MFGRGNFLKQLKLAACRLGSLLTLASFPLILGVSPLTFVGAGGTQAAEPRLLTQWGEQFDSENCWNEYPRPQMRRKRWLNLNGKWQLALTSATATRPDRFERQVLVPFPVESYLSGLQIHPTPDNKLWYRRTFATPAQWRGERVWLRFGAVDWSAEVWVNGRRIGDHRGGYDPFCYDVTDALRDGAENELVVAVIDPTDAGFQPQGKQTNHPKGIWYTPVSGIWQTVWLEPTPVTSIRSLRITPDAEKGSVTVTVAVGGADDLLHRVRVTALNGGKLVASRTGRAGASIELSIEKPELWTPAEPVLYDLRVSLLTGEETIDEVESYFGLRSVSIGPDQNGLTRILLNGEPLFQYGPLDQGYWPDGLYTPPSDEAMRSELQLIKELGFNMVRKHVKVEPARWYYWCDKLGLLVWQDMPSGGRKVRWPEDGVEANRLPVSAAQYRLELRAMIDNLYNAPSIVVWIPFNEAWGQFETEAITQWVKQYDPSRVVISASGGNDFGVGDVNDDHFYPGPVAPPAEVKRAAVLGEFGGFGLPLSRHSWQDEANWAYRGYRTREDLTSAYVDAMAKLRPLVESHLSAAVYTQITDVESEINGLLTYDRKVLKIDKAVLRREHAKLFAPLPRLSAAQQDALSTLAWWRFEHLEPGKPVPNIAERMGVIAVQDASGHNNHLYAFSRASAPAAAAIRRFPPQRAVDRLGQICLDTRQEPGGGAPEEGAPVRELFTNPGLSDTHMDVLDWYPFSEWTIEASFWLADASRSQVLLAKQGDPAHGSRPPLQLGVFKNSATGDGQIELHMIDGSGQKRTVRCALPIVDETWYHVVAVCDGRELQLYLRLDAAAQFVQEDVLAVDGALQRSSGAWIVGRGFRGSDIDNAFRGLIDEVRISTMAREKSSFRLNADGEDGP